MQIRQHDLSERVLIVAEIGNNHEGDLRVARELVVSAAACGVDAVKFQTFRTRHFTSAVDPARFERLRRFELTPEQFAELAALARAHGVLFISTPLDLESAAVLEPLVDAFKIASGDNDFQVLIDRAARSGLPVLISTGLVDLAHVVALEERFMRDHPAVPLAFLHCVSAYPVADDEANVAAVATMRAALRSTVGYSDHTLGVEAAVLAVALGARIIEKHFTLDKAYSDFRDHSMSADPEEMEQLVTRVRRAEQLLGSGEKRVQACEIPIAAVARRSVVAAGDFPAGHRLAAPDLTWIRPAGGVRPGEEALLLGRSLVRAVTFGERLSAEDVE